MHTNKMTILNFLRYLYTAFHSGYTRLHSPQQCRRALLSPHPHQHLLVDFLIIVILISVRWYLTVVLICSSLMISDIEHLFICLGAIWMSSSEKNLFSSIVHVFLFFGFFGVEFWVYRKKPKTLIWKNISTPHLIAALFTIAKIWK